MVAALREVQIPLLAALLLLGCAGKALRVLKSGAIAAGLGPNAVFPTLLRRPVALAMCAIELFLGVALLATAGRLVPWPAAANTVRLGVTLLFITATGALIELHTHHPDIGCGCFGDVSAAPVSSRTIIRSALFTIAAAATIGVPPVHFTVGGVIPGAVHGTMQARLLALAVLAEVALIGALSAELGEILLRLGYREPCEMAALPAQRTLAALLASRTWRRHASLLTSTEPTDVWRELCWRFMVFQAEVGGRTADVVFAVYTRRWRPPVRVAIVDALTGERVTASGQPCAPMPGQDDRPGRPRWYGWPAPGPRRRVRLSVTLKLSSITGRQR
jgi:hypothetical protein